MVAEQLSSLPLFCKCVWGGINGVLPVEESLCISIRCDTSADFLIFTAALCRPMFKNHFVCLFVFPVISVTEF